MDLPTPRLGASVVAVPPLARDENFEFEEEQNRKIVGHLAAGGVRTLLYGGNANFYHVGTREYPVILGKLQGLAPQGVWLVPSVGPAFGTMMDQAEILRDFSFETVMVLPASFPMSPSGAERGIRIFCERAGMPVVLYLKQEGYLAPQQVRALVEDGLVSAIKYAIVREDPASDVFLRELVDKVDPARIISGIGEQPAVVHLRDFGLGGFTSGCVCIAPSRSMQMLAALRSGDFGRAERIRSRFAGLEVLRNKYGPIPVLHEAVRLAGVSETGPILPLAANLDESLWEAVGVAARDLLGWELAGRAA